jgi:hypothetical protein
MDNSTKKQPAVGDRDVPGDTERRRIGRVVHDERGNATVDWHDAPADYKRTKLEIADGPPGAPSVPQTFNPYERPTVRDPNAGNTTIRKDLRKLSEWIKQMRELEERKRNDDAE